MVSAVFHSPLGAAVAGADEAGAAARAAHPAGSVHRDAADLVPSAHVAVSAQPRRARAGALAAIDWGGVWGRLLPPVLGNGFLRTGQLS